MTLYRIKDWNKHYENDRSRTRKACSWCAIPNKQHGLGYANLMSEPDGPAIYGAFVAMVLMASRQASRDGYLTVSGLPADSPLTHRDISAVTRIPAAVVKRALEVCSSSAIGWIEVTADSPRTPAALPADSPRTPLEEKRIEGKELNMGEPPPATKPGEETRKPERPTVEQAIAYGKEIGLPDSESRHWHDHNLAKGWIVGRVPMKDWKAAMRTWRKNWETYRAQRNGQHQAPRSITTPVGSGNF